MSVAKAKNICLLHANCQGEALADLLILSPEFAGEWQVRHYVNYMREPVPLTALGQCDFFVYQHLGEHWGELASERLRTALRQDAKTCCIPNMFFKGYWPFWTSTSPIDYGDYLLDKLIDSGAEKSVILASYYKGSIQKFVNLDTNLTSTLKIEEEKEKLCDIKTTELVRTHWKNEFLFYACNHPAKRLLIYTANEILAKLGLKPLTEAVTKNYLPDYGNFELPIHPQVAAHFELAFLKPDSSFKIFDRRLTFLEYISRYIDCRQLTESKDFLGYLQLI